MCTNITWRYLGTVITVAALLQITVSTADADILGQTPGTDFLAFEAEDVDSITNADPSRGWLIADSINPITTAFGSAVLAPDTTASRGTGLFDSRGNDPDHVTYKLQFSEPGTYSLYYRYTLFESSDPPDDGYGGEDSIYLGSDFGVVPTGGQEDPSNLRANHPGGGTPGDGRWEGNFDWWNVSITDEDPDSASNPSGTYTPTVNTVLDFSFGSRERGVLLDKLVFSLNDSLSDAELDALPTISLLPGAPGDFNLDGTVDLADFNILTANFSESFSITESFGKGDNNRDTSVDLLDFIEFREVFNNQGQGVAGVPEPSGIALSGLALVTTIALLRRKR